MRLRQADAKSPGDGGIAKAALAQAEGLEAPLSRLFPLARVGIFSCHRRKTIGRESCSGRLRPDRLSDLGPDGTARRCVGVGLLLIPGETLLQRGLLRQEKSDPVVLAAAALALPAQFVLQFLLARARDRVGVDQLKVRPEGELGDLLQRAALGRTP